MRFFANQLQEKDKKMRDLVHMSVKARIAQSLISLKNQFGETEEGYIAIELSRQDLSAFAGVSYETLFKVIVELTDQEVVQTHEKRFKINREDDLTLIIANDQNKNALKYKAK